MNSDFKELLSALNGFQVKYLIIGGYAVMKYAEPRFTKDLDILIKADNENARAVFNALKALGSPLEGMSVGDFAHEGYFHNSLKS